MAGAGTIAAAALPGPAASVLPPAYGATVHLLLPHALAGGALAMASMVAALDLAAGRRGGPVLLIAGAVVHLVALLGIATDTAGVAWIHASLVVCSATAVVARRPARTHRRVGIRRAATSTPTRNPTPTRTGHWMPSTIDRSRTSAHETPEDALLELSVVIPAFNEQARIVPTIGAFAAHLAERELSWELIVSDDGSSDATRELVALLDQPNVRLVVAPANRGKGAAVRRGLLAARGRLVLFADADNAAPAQELDLLLDAARRGADIAVGSRAAEGAQVRNRSLLRSALTAGLRRTVRVSLGITVRDAQCGFKLFTAAAARRVAAAQTIDGFAFDLEMLHIAQRLGLAVEEVPVRWFDAPGSKVRPGREVLRFLLSIGHIRLTAVRGGYRHA
ncbi:dolichyl-phosphate beta-glucosyltransferase [Amnibacterium kyonggiense]